MTTLTDLVQAFRDAKLQKEADERTAACLKLEQLHAARIPAFWNPLAEHEIADLLGLDEKSLEHDDQEHSVSCEGQARLGDLTLRTHAKATFTRDGALPQQFGFRLVSIPTQPWKRDEKLLSYAHETWPDLRLRLVAAASAFLDHLPLWQAKERRYNAALLTAAQIIAAAREYESDWAAYDTHCQHWAEENTALLWRPWDAWEISYVPISPHGRYPWPHNQDTGLYTRTALVLDPLEMVIAQHPAPLVQAVTECGVVEDLAIGALFDARPKLFDEKNLYKPIPFHRSVRAGSWVVNYPPMSTSDPSPHPNCPPPFEEFLHSRLPDQPISLFPFSAQELADMNPADVVAKLFLADM